MDLSHEAAFLQMLTGLKQKKKKTFLVVLHDLTVAAQYADDFVVLDGGRLVFAGTKQECLDGAILEKTFALKRYTVGEKGRIFFSAE